MKKALQFSIFILGFSTMSAQIVFLREFLITFYGNEFSIGFVLGAWLFSGAIGSLILGRFTDKLREKTNIFLFCQLLASILLVLVFLGIRLIKPAFNIVSGEIIPLSIIAIASFIILLPLCMLFGFMFTLGCKIYQSENNATSIARVYIFETIGAMAAGVVTSFILISLIKSVYIVGILVILNILSAFFLSLFLRKNFYRIITCSIILFLLIFGISLYSLKGWDKLDEFSLKKQWQGFSLIAYGNSIYGNIALAKKDGQIAFFNNGFFLYAVPDKEMAEAAVHFTLLEHPQPKDILLVGAGVAGLAEESLKHPVRTVTYVELDPLLTRMAEKELSPDYLNYLKDRRLSIENIDARLFIKKTVKKYDCVVVNLGDPLSAQLNRYYTVEFFQEVKNILKDGGIFSFKVSSSENYINADLKYFLQSLYLTLKNVFKDVKVIPGDTAIFLASDKTDVLTVDYKILEERSKERNLDIKYVRDYYLFSKLSPQRVSYIEKILNENISAAINYDFRPASYFYATIFWLSYFRDSIFSALFKTVNENIIWTTFFIAIFFVSLSGLITARNKNIKNIIVPAILAAGFSQMSLQVIILLSFQLIYGYLFYSLGFLLTAFMAGLSLGALFIVKIIPRIKNEIKIFIYTQAAIFVYCLLLPLLLNSLNISKGPAMGWLGADILFPLVSLAGGFIGGMQFPLANRIYLKHNAQVGETAGLLYGVDLLGACLGAFLVSIFLIPILGVVKTCYLMGILNFSILLILVILGMKKE